MSNDLHRRVVHKVNYRSMSTTYVGGLSTNKNKYLSLITMSYMAHCMCEGVREDSRHGTGHVDIQVGLCIILLEYVCLSLHEHLGGE